MDYEKVTDRFTAETNDDGKQIMVFGPNNFELGITIDHDDVDHETVGKQTGLLLDILEEHWPKA